ncbi:hypothetical protein [Mesorhizobium sp. Mes31]|uniref:hypothetical protein n=1 Tax=Mesorhizobium sp. Mes31 TaxID=2926017 RepID=UPI002118261E|nr:hypothetical protein [Mesorhizobium sp. Mes31]
MSIQAQATRASRSTKSSLRQKSEIPWRQRPWLPLTLAADLLGVSSTSLYRLEAEGQLCFRRFVGRTVVMVASILPLIDGVEEWTPSKRGAAARQQRTERLRAEAQS